MGPGDRPFLSVVIPAYNEADNIRAGALERVSTYLYGQDYTYEVVVVDDGSEDDTASLAEAFAHRQNSLRVLRATHGGKAHALMRGMRTALGEVVLFCDMDQATPISEVAKLLPWFDQGYDIVIASRGTTRQDAPWWRKVMSRGQGLLRDVILGSLQVTDSQCGFKAFRRETIEPILGRLYLYGPDTRFDGATVASGFDVEVLFVAKKLGYKTREVLVEWSYQETRRVSFVKDAVHGLQDLVRIRWADLRGAYTTRGET
jgi:glycosyltransferase involved in cell wall biosynthesis